MSTHVVPVVEIKDVRPHPNADKLDLTTIGGWQCAVQKGSFRVGDLAVYIEPDFMVPVTRPEFAFLKSPTKFDQTYARIQAKRLRGEMSFGLLIPVRDVQIALTPEGAKFEFTAGDNLIDVLGITRWEPPMVSSNRATQGFNMAHAKLPNLPNFTTKFDIESLNNFADVLDLPTESVVVTEKVHGVNARFCWWNGEFYVGSRSHWLRDPTEQERSDGHKSSVWHTVARKTPEIERWCRYNEGTILYGEVYGNVQDLKYGLNNDARFVGFAAYDCVTGRWADTLPLFERLDFAGVPRVPVLATGVLTRDTLESILEEDSAIASSPDGHMREGVIITPERERTDPRVGRVSLKLISNRYWTRKL